MAFPSVPSFRHDALTTPLSQRLQDDTLMQGLGCHTWHDYIRRVRRFATFFRRAPVTATVEEYDISVESA